MFWLVPDYVGTCDASKREGPRCGATEEVVGMVRGPSEGLVMVWIACEPLRYDDRNCLTGTSQWDWGDRPTGDSGKWPEVSPSVLLTTGCQPEPECGGGRKLKSVKYKSNLGPFLCRKF
jgi:hypothetical protein